MQLHSKSSVPMRARCSARCVCKVALAMALLGAAACGDSTAMGGGDAPTPDAPDPGEADAGSGPAVDAAPPMPDPPPDAAACRAPAEGDSVVEVFHDGRTRDVRVHVPTGYDECGAAPLVVNLHALGSSAAIQEAYTRTSDKADAEGFVVAYPQGVAGSWNAGGCCGGAMAARTDDVGFIDAALDRLLSDFAIDPARVYVTGMSNGGFMTYRVACELSERIAAAAPVAGINATGTCEPTRSVPLLHIHGQLDTVVPFAGGVLSAEGWAERNGCGDTRRPVIEVAGGRCEAFEACPDRADVTLCRLAAAGHVWPGGVASPAVFDATDLMWDFVSRYRLP